jgi:hypothetical protein
MAGRHCWPAPLLDARLKLQLRARWLCASAEHQACKCKKDGSSAHVDHLVNFDRLPADHEVILVPDASQKSRCEGYYCSVICSANIKFTRTLVARARANRSPLEFVILIRREPASSSNQRKELFELPSLAATLTFEAQAR